MRHTLLLLWLFATMTAHAQVSINNCTYKWGTTMQNLSGIVTWTQETCPTGYPAAAGVVPFPGGATVTLPSWRNVDGPGQGYYGNVSPLGSQPNTYIVMGKDNNGHSIADFEIGNSGATTFGGIHVGWYTPQGTHGNELDIITSDSLLLKELWVTEGATCNIYGQVYITEECHNAGTITVHPGGKLTFLADREYHKHSILENRGTINGKIYYEALYNTGPTLAPYGTVIDWLPSNISDTISPFLSDVSYLEWQEYFVNELVEYVPYPYMTSVLDGSGYSVYGIPLQGVRLNPYDGDFLQKERFKAWFNSNPKYAWAGRAEDVANSIGLDNAWTLISIQDGDTIFFNPTDPNADTWQTDTSLYNNGVFESFQYLYDRDFAEDLEAYNNADSLSWVPYATTGGFYHTFYPNWINTMVTRFDIRAGSELGNAVWIDPQHSFIADSTGLNPYNINTGLVYNEVPEPWNEYYPDGFKLPPIQGTASEATGGGVQAADDFAVFATLDHNTPIHQPIGLWVYLTYGNTQAAIWEYGGYPWLNSAESNQGEYYESIPYENQAIPIYHTETDHEVSIYLPNAPGQVFIYNTNGIVFEYYEYTNCIDAGYTEEYCSDSLDSYLLESIVDDPIITQYTGVYNPSGVNRWVEFSNPTNGYLDLNAVAETYFNDHPDVNHLEFLWWAKDPVQAANYNVNPNNLLSLTEATTQNWWRRKYHRFNGDIYNSEIDFWISLLADFAEANPYVQNDLIQTFITDYQTDSVINSNEALNFIAQDTLNPFSYTELGRYLTPSGSLHAKNAAATPTELRINVDHAVYDFDLPETIPGYQIAGDYDLGARQSADSALTTLLLTVDFKNDTSYWPHVFMYHTYQEGATNGIQPAEEGNAYDTYRPFLFEDSTQFYAYTWIAEATPHNNSPLTGLIPSPDSAFCITPLVFQDGPSDVMDLDSPFKYIGIRTHNKTDTVTYANGEELTFTSGTGPITYLSEGDTLWYRKRDFPYPVTVELYFTNLEGDFTGDGLVGSADFVDFFTAYGDCTTDIPVNPYIQNYDLDEDGCVDVQDYLTMIQYYNHTLHADGSFDPIPFGEEPISAEIVVNNSPNLRSDPNVSVSGQVIRIPGELIKLYDRQFNLIAERVGQVTAPLSDVYTIVTNRRLGHLDFRP